MSNEINKRNTINFLASYIIGALVSELCLLMFGLTFGKISFFLIGNAGIMLAILFGYLTYRSEDQ